MKKIYVSLWWHKDCEKDETRARIYCRLVYDAGHFPVCAHLYLRKVLDYSKDTERVKALQLAHETLKQCDEIWVFGDCNKKMIAETITASVAGVKIKYFDTYGNEL